MANIFTNIMDTIFGKPETPSDNYDRAAAEEAARQKRIKEGLANIENVFGQYDQDFYDQTQDAYIDYYQPQLEDQYQKGLQELQYALARSGRLNRSSTDTYKKAQAAQDMEVQKQDLASKSLAAAGQSEADVQAAKEKMIKLNLANADPDLAASLSASQASLLNQPPKYDQLVDVFSDITEGLASREELENRRKLRDSSRNFEKRSSASYV